MSQMEELIELQNEVKRLKRKLKEEDYKTKALQEDVKELTQRMLQLEGHRHSYGFRTGVGGETGVNQKRHDHSLSPYQPRRPE